MKTNKNITARLSGLAAVLALLVSAQSRAEVTPTDVQTAALENAHNVRALSMLAFDAAKADLQSMTVFDLVNWKIGDNMAYSMEIATFGNLGTMTKVVTKEEGKAVWFTEEADLSVMGQSQKDVTETLINRADGKILKMIHNGQEQAVPDDKLEVISQDVATITVPAGTFKALHIVAKTQQVSKIELWANPQQTCMDGALQVIAATQMGDLTMKLTSFKRN